MFLCISAIELPPIQTSVELATFQQKFGLKYTQRGKTVNTAQVDVVHGNVTVFRGNVWVGNLVHNIHTGAWDFYLRLSDEELTDLMDSNLTYLNMRI